LPFSHFDTLQRALLKIFLATTCERTGGMIPASWQRVNDFVIEHTPVEVEEPDTSSWLANAWRCAKTIPVVNASVELIVGFWSGFSGTFTGMYRFLVDPLCTATAMATGLIGDGILDTLGNIALFGVTNTLDPFHFWRISANLAQGNFYEAGSYYGRNAARATIMVCMVGLQIIFKPKPLPSEVPQLQPKDVPEINANINPVEGLPRVGSALKGDLYHKFPDIVDNYASIATQTQIPNATLFQIKGSFNGVIGRFEWIVQNGEVTHRFFVPGGSINGIPNIP